MSVLFVFVDGLGIAPQGPGNPLSRVKEPPLGLLCGNEAPGFRLIEADACLGVEGVPQSATGGTALFTGVNAPKAVGRHVQALPNTQLRRIISRNGLLRRAREKGAAVGFANTYTPPFFKRGRNRIRSVTTVMAESAGLRLNRLEDLIAGRAVYRDYTNGLIVEQGHDVARLDAEEAGGRLGKLARTKDLLIYEFFQTDHTGHRGTTEDALEVLADLNRFLQAALRHIDPDVDTFVLSSDHGNVEDMETSAHTTNPVPILLYGKGADTLLADVSRPNICHVTPLILSIISSRLLKDYLMRC